VYDVVEKTSTRRRSRISCVVVEKVLRVDVKTAPSSSKKYLKSQRTFNKNSCDLFATITCIKISVAYLIISDKN